MLDSRMRTIHFIHGRIHGDFSSWPIILCIASVSPKTVGTYWEGFEYCHQHRETTASSTMFAVVASVCTGLKTTIVKDSKAGVYLI